MDGRTHGKWPSRGRNQERTSDAIRPGPESGPESPEVAPGLNPKPIPLALWFGEGTRNRAVFTQTEPSCGGCGTRTLEPRSSLTFQAVALLFMEGPKTSRVCGHGPSQPYVAP